MASSRLILLRRLITSARSAPSARVIHSVAPLQRLFKTHPQQISCLSDEVFARDYATDRRPTKMPKRAVSESDDEDFDEDDIDTEDLDSEDLGSDDLTEDLDSEDFTEGDDDEDDDEDFYSEEASEEEEDTKKKSKKK